MGSLISSILAYTDAPLVLGGLDLVLAPALAHGVAVVLAVPHAQEARGAAAERLYTHTRGIRTYITDAGAMDREGHTSVGRPTTTTNSLSDQTAYRPGVHHARTWMLMGVCWAAVQRAAVVLLMNCHFSGPLQAYKEASPGRSSVGRVMKWPLRGPA
jgi:hypothetical protein